MPMTFLALAAAAPLHFDCTGPVTATMSARDILAQYGKAARREDIPGAEGETAKAVVLYPDDPSRRLVITFWDDAQTAVQSVTAGPEATAWAGPLGLHPGTPLAEVVKANIHNFSFTGLGWDYGGYIVNFWNGRLTTLPGGCAAQVRLGVPAGAKVPRAVEGEHELNTTMAPVKAAGLRLDTVSIGWPLPPDIKVAN
jgi:hypothetical protein